MSWFGGGNNMEKHLFNLKFAAKQLERTAKKCEKEAKTEQTKLKQAIQKGNMEGARIHAENSIRNKNQSLNFLRMGSRIDAVASRVETAVRMKQVTSSMAGVVKAMDQAASSMNIEKISMIMDKFEQQFENLDVQSQYMENSMNSSTTLTVPEDQVDSLMHQVADEHGLELNMELNSNKVPDTAASNAAAEQDELSDRLARLRQNI
ncbi:chromatin modifying protein 1b [Capsaspora owczarzaki ATCC 30864]|uniref:Chromatin modifying protein 1b n=1 Tax=Capsaspora owczarzaki (strain ATCC 30864) TaxID=595528 RepID=A0A0D2X114_CAPO3|nr:chromatin modifying protein 1b [Capsaspora owczarzaki ATCC 30864]KJE90014.1 chromatin modifying protein 1b [Capsaspora owczarzaki ATCC 30864]|eukprot:XP_004349918.1 chromatin modifying protein 1b [Capsaspora owczarzaki ATCC 30864]